MRLSIIFCLSLSLLLFSVGCKKEPNATSRRIKPMETTTPLHAAARRGYIERAQSLIANGADVNAKDKNG